VEIGSALLPVGADAGKFSEGQSVKLVFRPEDVSLSRPGDLPASNNCLGNGVVQEVKFAGAHERLSLRLDLTETGACEPSETPFYLTTETPESQSTKPIIATRLKPESNAVRLRVGDRVVIGLTSFTILPDNAATSQRASSPTEISR
jgi:hypothetical protein